MAGGVKGIAALAMEAAVALGGTMSRPRKVANPFRYFRWSAEAIHLAVRCCQSKCTGWRSRRLTGSRRACHALENQLARSAISTHRPG